MMDTIQVVRLSNDRDYLCQQVECRRMLCRDMVGRLYPRMVEAEIEEIQHLIALLTPL